MPNSAALMPMARIIFMSPLFSINRYLMQFYAAKTHSGLSADFVKEYSWFGLFVVMVRAYTAALWHLPRMLRERHRLSKRRRITTREWYDLISRFKLDAIELALKY